ncbi:MAG: PorP/SprF family type IX secretion system membrane protein [Bacteroidetes bacterium]|nr:PorP/SprF family type IX secretion system membrane protein [Bacteroidota bacterium]
MAGSVQAQSTTRFDQFSLEPSMVSPAAINSRGLGSVSLFYNHMYGNIPGTPENMSLNVAVPVAYKKVGFGIQFTQEKIGFSNLQNWNASYVYTVQLSDRSNLHLGMALGMLNQKFDLSKAIYNDPDDAVIEAILLGTRTNRLDMRASAMFQTGDFKIGISGSRFVKPRFDYNYFRYRSDYQLQSIVNALVMHKIRLGLEFSIEPSVLVTFYDLADPRIQANAMCNYRDKIWAGPVFTDNRLGGAMAGMNIRDVFRVGYSFVAPMTSVNTQLGATHELFTSFSLGYAKVPPAGNDGGAAVTPRVVDTPQVAEVATPKPVVPKPAPAPKKRDTVMVNSFDEMKMLRPGIDTSTMMFPAMSLSKPAVPGYYVVVGSYAKEVNADYLLRKLYVKGVTAFKFRDVRSSYYYVYIYRGDTREQADLVRFKETNLDIPGIWIYNVKPPVTPSR